MLSAADEEAFLAPWVQQAMEGGILVVSPLRAALAQKVGRPVSATVLYRMLERHGWRKVAPDTRHPKIQEDWKIFPKVPARLLGAEQVKPRCVRVMF